jgi:hypothetical protein
MAKKKRVKARKRTLPKAIRELAKDPIFKEPSMYSQGRAMESFLQQERRQGHSALRMLRDGRLEVFDPNPGAEDASPETDAFTRGHTRTPAEWFQFCRKIEQRLRVAQREYKKGWDAFYRLRRSVAQKQYPTLTNIVKPA